MEDGASTMSGWLPIYDTMHGIRGELKVVVKLEFFSDFNKFRQSSCGMKIFHGSGVPHGYKIQGVHGFVEELVVNDDPEYDWMDKIRSMRASNEARQIQFSKLSGQLQRKIGLKVLEMGGNAVIGYRQCFDLEGETGVVVRGIGTSVSVQKVLLASCTPPTSSVSPARDVTLSEECALPSSPINLSVGAKVPSSPLKSGGATFACRRRSSDSDIGTPPKGGSLCGSTGSGSALGTAPKIPYHRPMLEQESIDMLEYPFFTVKSFPPGFLMHLGGVVSARSVKLLDRIHNPDEPETRDTWWTELRTEVRSHTRAMGCHAVVGYSEETSICDEIIVLSACGTAAIVNLQLTSSHSLTVSLDRYHFEKEKDKTKLRVDVNLANQVAADRFPTYPEYRESTGTQCSICHVPYKESSLPFKVQLSKCGICRQQKVPDILFTTVEVPTEVPIRGKGCLVQARIFRHKKDGKGEANAKEISESLPFMEIELHNQLLNKLKMKGMNSLYGLKLQFSVGDRLLVAIATATAVFTAAMASPLIPKLSAKSGVQLPNLADMQCKVLDVIKRNRETYGLPFNVLDHGNELSPRAQLTDESEDETANDTELSIGNKDAFVLEIDDAEDAKTVSLLFDPVIPTGFELCNTEVVPGVYNYVTSLQMFTRIWRGHVRNDKLNNLKSFSLLFDNIIKSLCFKLRIMSPCALCHLDFDVDIPKEDEIQVRVTGKCLGLGDTTPPTTDLMKTCNERNLQRGDTDDLMFQLDMSMENTATCQNMSKVTPIANVSKVVKEQRVRCRSDIGVDITPLSYLPQARIDQYLGHINFFLIRESTSVRENGGLNGFLHNFVAEVKAICRAHVTCLGGNALIAYRMSECILDENLHKNQSQCLVNVSGDIVLVSYGTDLPQHSTYTPLSSGSSKTGSVSPLPTDNRVTPPKSSPRNTPII